MSDLGQWLFERERDTIEKMITRQASHRQAFVTSINTANGTVTVADPYSATNEAQPLKVLGDMPAAIGEPVVLHPLAGGDRVASRLASHQLSAYQPINRMAGWTLSGRAVNLRWTHTIAAGVDVPLVANRLFSMPFFCPQTITVDAMMFNVTTFLAGDVIAGIYAASGLLQAQELLASTAKTTISAIGVKTQLLTTPLELVAGTWYMLAVVATSAMGIQGVNTPGTAPGIRGGVNTVNLTGHYTAGYVTLTAGWTSLPDPFGGTTSLLNTFYDVFARVSSA